MDLPNNDAEDYVTIAGTDSPFHTINESKIEEQPLQQCRSTLMTSSVNACDRTSGRKSLLSAGTNKTGNKRYRIPNPDEVFQELESQKNVDTITDKRKVLLNIASVLELLNQEEPDLQEDLIRKKNSEKIIFEESKKAFNVRQEFNSDKSCNIIIFTNNSTNIVEEDQLLSVKTNQQSNQAVREQHSELEGNLQVKKGEQLVEEAQKMRDKSMQNQANNFEVIIAACLARMDYNIEYRKYKVELDDRNITINRCFVIPLKSIIKIKVIRGYLNRPELKITFCDQLASNITKDDWQRVLSNGNLWESFKKITKKEQKVEQKVIMLCDGYELIYTFYASIIVRKLYQQGHPLPTQMQVNSFMMPAGISQNYQTSGMIMKLSKHLKKWQQRYMEIKQHRLSSYVKRNEQKQEESDGPGKCTLKIKSITEMWTRFNLTQDKLVVKLFHNRQKYQLGIPLHNYANILEEGNWLYGLTTVMRGPD